LSVTQNSPFIIDRSSVHIFMSGSTTLTANSDEYAGLECSGFSNISVAAIYLRLGVCCLPVSGLELLVPAIVLKL
jgi:hypothetical protein